jgi:hypothetical protein
VYALEYLLSQFHLLQAVAFVVVDVVVVVVVVALISNVSRVLDQRRR